MEIDGWRSKKYFCNQSAGRWAGVQMVRRGFVHGLRNMSAFRPVVEIVRPASCRTQPI